MIDVENIPTMPRWELSEPDGIPEERAGVNLSICKHGWKRELCGTCTPIKRITKPKSNVPQLQK